MVLFAPNEADAHQLNGACEVTLEGVFLPVMPLWARITIALILLQACFHSRLFRLPSKAVQVSHVGKNMLSTFCVGQG